MVFRGLDQWSGMLFYIPKMDFCFIDWRNNALTHSIKTISKCIPFNRFAGFMIQHSRADILLVNKKSSKFKVEPIVFWHYV